MSPKFLKKSDNYNKNKIAMQILIAAKPRKRAAGDLRESQIMILGAFVYENQNH
jgi:hypothetical protein